MEEIIQRLKKENFINEQRFAQAFVHDKFLFNKWGKIKIRNALAAKNIPDSIITEALQTIDEQEYLKTLEKLAKQKLKSLQKETDKQKLKSKILRYLSSKGYEFEKIKSIVDEIIENQ